MSVEALAVVCPYCDFEYEGRHMPTEIAHMTTWHPEVVAKRLSAIGEPVSAESIRAAAGPYVPPMPLREQALLELRRLMEAEGIRQTELARRIGMTDAQLSLIFTAKRKTVTIKTLERIAAGLGVRFELRVVR